MSVASCRIIFLCLISCFRVRCLVLFQILLRGLFSNLWLCVPRGFGPRCGPAQPNLTQPGLAQLGPRAPSAPLSFLSFDFSRAATTLSPISLSYGALGFGDGDRRSWIPEVSSPPLPSPLSPSSSPSPSLPCVRPPSPLRACPLQPLRAAPCGPGARPSAPSVRPGPAPSPAAASALAAWPAPTPPPPAAVLVAPAPRRDPGPLRAAPATGGAAQPPAHGLRPPARGVPAPGGATPRPPRAWPLGPLCAAVPAPVRGPCPRQRGPRRGSSRVPARIAWPRRGLHGLAPPVHPARSRVRSPTHAVIYSWFLINFKTCLVSVLRRALRRATNLSNFIFY
jgi:hypothetical protein